MTTLSNTNTDSDTDSDDSIMDYLVDTTNTNVNTNTDINIIDKPIILGIDLGTTNSCISIWRNNTCEIIPDEYGNKTIPSYVSFTNVSKYVGYEAKKQKDINVENVFYEVKRLIGRSYDEQPVQDCLKFLSYKVIKNERDTVSLQSTVRDNKIFTPEEVSANVLMKLKDMAQKYLKRDVKDVVITVPAHFNDSQRQSTKDAASIAGLNCVRMFHEPTAAALAYGMLDRSVNKAYNAKAAINTNVDTDSVEYESEDESDNDKKGMLILVYDFGGGTLDVSLIDVFDGIFDVVCSSGISHLGGVDFDNRLMNYCIATFAKQHYKNCGAIEMDKISRLSMQRLRTQCESVKKVLSTNVSDRVAIENFYDGKDMFVKINRADFENLCRDLFLLCLYPIDELLTECGKTERDIDEVILVGGMTRMPYIREMLNNRFRTSDNKSKVNCSINPDEAVSVGAAIQGYILANKDDAFADSVTLMDITPLSIGVEVIGGVMDCLIKRNTMIPCEQTKMYSTDTDNVDSVLIKIFEGERVATAENFKIGEFELDKIPLQQRGVPEIEITFAVDINGIVTVSACEKEVNEMKSIIVNTNKNGLKPHQLAALIEEAIEQETMDELDRVKRFSYYEMEDLCSNIVSNIQNKEFKLTPRDITTITEDVSLIAMWLKEKNYKDRDIEEFEEALHKMKKKYGVLILQGKLEFNKVKANAEELEATTLYGKDDDEEELELKQAFKKVEDDELGVVDGMSDLEIVEIKDLRDALMELCKNVCSIIHSGHMNIDRTHRQEILNYIDDVMMWYYSHEKPTKIDYKEKIDYVNSICDEIVESYDTDGKDLFTKGELDKDTDNNSQKLEKLCLTMITMIDTHQIPGSKASLALLTNKIKRILKFVYTHAHTHAHTHAKTDNNDNNNDNDTEFQNMCGVHIQEINDMCDNVYNNLQGITMRDGPVVTLSTPITVEKPKIVTDEFTINYKNNNNNNNDPDEKRGMTILELLRMKQNDEMEEAIDRQINNVSDYDHIDDGDEDEDLNLGGSDYL